MDVLKEMRYLKVSNVLLYLNVSKSTFLRWANKYDLKRIVIDKNVLYDINDIDKLMERFKQ